MLLFSFARLSLLCPFNISNTQNNNQNVHIQIANFINNQQNEAKPEQARVKQYRNYMNEQANVSSVQCLLHRIAFEWSLNGREK